MAPEDLFDAIRSVPVPDIFVVDADGARLTELRLIAELRARPETESAAIVVVGGGEEPEFGIMALDLGAGDVLPAGFDADELVLRLRARLKQKRDIERRQRRVEEGLRLAVTDPLTGLLNRRATFARLNAIAAEARTTQQGYALMILDIDHFKLINDSYGHAAGDAVLTEVARRLAAFDARRRSAGPDRRRGIPCRTAGHGAGARADGGRAAAPGHRSASRCGCRRATRCS